MTPELTKQEIDAIVTEAERILKLAYVRHTTEVNPDDNWADWETCKKDGTVEMVLEAMTKQVTSERLKHKAEIQAYREALDKAVEVIKQWHTQPSGEQEKGMIQNHLDKIKQLGFYYELVHLLDLQRQECLKSIMDTDFYRKHKNDFPKSYITNAPTPPELEQWKEFKPKTNNP